MRIATLAPAAPICPVCKVRERSFDDEPGSGGSYFSTCSTCSSHLAYAPACNRPECLVGGHTSVKATIVGFADADKKDPIYACQQGCGKSGDKLFWAKRRAWFSAVRSVRHDAPSLRQVRLDHQRKAAAYRTGGPGLAAPATIAYAQAYVAYVEHLLAQG